MFKHLLRAILYSVSSLHTHSNTAGKRKLLKVMKTFVRLVVVIASCMYSSNSQNHLLSVDILPVFITPSLYTLRQTTRKPNTELALKWLMTLMSYSSHSTQSLRTHWVCPHPVSECQGLSPSPTAQLPATVHPGMKQVLAPVAGSLSFT